MSIISNGRVPSQDEINTKKSVWIS